MAGPMETQSSCWVPDSGSQSPDHSHIHSFIYSFTRSSKVIECLICPRPCAKHGGIKVNTTAMAPAFMEQFSYIERDGPKKKYVK